MLENKDVFVDRCREGYKFFKTLRQSKVQLAAAKAAAVATTHITRAAQVICDI